MRRTDGGAVVGRQLSVRIRHLVVVAVAVLVAASCTSATSGGVASEDPPSTTALGSNTTIGQAGGGVGPTIGSYIARRDGDQSQSTFGFEAQLGADLGVIRVFERWDSVFPRDFHLDLRDRGKTMIFSVKARRKDGTDVFWRDIASAQPGSPLHDEMTGWVDRIRDYGSPMYFTFHHEADGSENVNNGTGDEFVRAWQVLADLLRERGATNATLVWNMTSVAFYSEGARGADAWYPGSAYVDVLSADIYNWYGCRGEANPTWRSMEDMIQPFLTWSQKYPDKPLMLSEFGSADDPQQPGRKAQWIADMQQLFKKPGYERFIALSYFNSHHGEGSTCEWWVDSTPEAFTAFSSFTADPFYNGPAR